LQEGIILLLSRWYALQMAIKNQWGGCDSIQKSHQLASHLFSWLSKSNGDCVVHYFFFLFHFLFIDSPSIINYALFVLIITAPICVEDLENLLHESMLLTFNTEIEDGSIEQVYIHTQTSFASHIFHF
jgi:pre-rRNA-processing protein TSR2